METWELICGIVVLVLAVLINIVCLLQEQKPQSASSALTGGADMDSYYGRNQGRTKEARLAKVTRILSIILVVLVVVMNIVVPIIQNKLG